MNTSVKLSVVIPLYNEVNTLEHVVEKVLAAPFDKEILIVDD
ncbi:MAG TPA: glycosyltransferase, partial [Candidatus Hydrogenedentes bacterium]|nr:glycosyltransferase [Candidatus Hydrogenedentota bacterium]